MGYYITIEYSDFFIPTEHLDAAYRALIGLNTDPAYADYKRSGSRAAPSFAWISHDYHQRASTAEDVFKMLGFETETNSEGLSVYYYDGKAGDEDLFFAVVAHLVEADSHIHIRGEDGAHLRYDFDGDSMTIQEGQIVFFQSRPARIAPGERFA